MTLPSNFSPSPDVSRKNRWLTWFLGMLVADLVTGLLYVGCFFLLKNLRNDVWFAIPSCFLLPLFGGLLASYLWRQLNPNVGMIVLNTLFMTLLALLGATFFLHEGVICLVIVSPLYYAMILTGALVGRVWFKRDSTRLHVSILPLLAFLALGEPLVRSDEMNTVTDEIIIHAPAAKIWPQVTTFPDIPAAPQFWLFRLGLPYPMATTSTGAYVNAERQCIFNRGAIFKETVAEWVPGEKLTFDIIESPPDPELVGHLTPQRGQFILRENGDGTTTLIGTTWYTLHVRPLWYFDWWTRHIFRAVHLRVMEDIRRRAEAAP